MKRKTALDELASYNQARWNELVEAESEFTCPFLDLDGETARRLIDPDGIIGDVTGKQVLCLASGGGQQSAAFALLGAQVTVFDLAEAQLAGDRRAAAHYGVEMQIMQGDMRDLSLLRTNTFDIVWHANSINYVPAVQPVLREVARVLRPGGLYRIEWHNPFTQTIDVESWNGQGYLLQHRYVDGRNLTGLFPAWQVENREGTFQQVASPQEFVHTLSTLINALVAAGFVLVHAREATGEDPTAEPGSWLHYMAMAAPWLTLWAKYRSDVWA